MPVWKTASVVVCSMGIGIGMVALVKSTENTDTKAIESTKEIMFDLTINYNKLLDSIAKVESNNNPNAIGADGERGAYQIMLGTWEEHSSYHFDMAFDPIISRQVAMNYIGWIEQTLEYWGIGRAVTIEDIAAAYNGGIGRYRRRGFDVSQMPQITQNYVRKVVDDYICESEK